MLGTNERRVDGQDKATIVSRRAQAGYDTRQRNANVGVVVEHRERQRQRIGALPDSEPLVAHGGKVLPGVLGKSCALESRECFGRAEPVTRAADEKDSRQP